MLMAWCFSTKTSVATVLTTRPCVSHCLGVKKLYFFQTTYNINFLLWDQSLTNFQLLSLISPLMLNFPIIQIKLIMHVIIMQNQWIMWHFNVFRIFKLDHIKYVYSCISASKKMHLFTLCFDAFSFASHISMFNTVCVFVCIQFYFILFNVQYCLLFNTNVCL